MSDLLKDVLEIQNEYYRFSVEVLADSMNPVGNRITTMKITFPRIVLAEFNTHRVFSRNSASSRAIPFNRMVEQVRNNSFVPIAFQKAHKGMQGTEYLNDYHSISNAMDAWHRSKHAAIEQATKMYETGVTKQLCNRLLEPFMYHTVIVTATEWENFFKLRCPQYEYKNEIFFSKKDCINSYINGLGKGFSEARDYLNSLSRLGWLKLNKSQAEIHIQEIAELMWDAMNESIPTQLKPEQWHFPFRKYDAEQLLEVWDGTSELFIPTLIKISTARCARISYETLGNDPKIDYHADLKLHNRLLLEGHMSPFEHCAMAKENSDWSRNFKGFTQYREVIESSLEMT